MPVTADNVGFVPDNADSIGFVPDKSNDLGFVPDSSPQFPIDKNLVGTFQPSQFSSGVPASPATGLNPDFDFTAATGGNPVGALVQAANEKLIEPAAADIGNTIAGDLFGKTPFEAGKPLLSDKILPMAKEQGVIPALTRAIQGFTTPAALATLPFAAESKLIQGGYLATAAASLPNAVERVVMAQSPAEARDAATELGLNVAMTALMKKGMEKASESQPTQVQETTNPSELPETAIPAGNSRFSLPQSELDKLNSITGKDLNMPLGAKPSPAQTTAPWMEFENRDLVNPRSDLVNLETEQKQPSQNLPLSPKMQEQLNATDVSISSGMEQTILDKKIKSPLAFQRVFPNLNVSLEEAQEVLNKVWGKFDNVPDKYLNRDTDMPVNATESPINSPSEPEPQPTILEPKASQIEPQAQGKPLPNAGAYADLPPELKAISDYNNSKEAFLKAQAEADAKKSQQSIEPKIEQQPKIEQGVASKIESKPAEQTSDDPFLSRIANRFTKERMEGGELGPVEHGKGYTAQELVDKGLKMKPEDVSKHISNLMNGKGGNPVDQAAAVRAEEARLSQKSMELSRAAEENPSDLNAKKAADDAFKILTDFHKGPVAKLKTIFHGVGEGLQGEIPVDLSTFNGLREAWLKDSGKEPPPRVEPAMRKMAKNVKTALSEERAAANRLGEEIGRVSKSKKLPSPEEVRDSIVNRMKDMPCRN